MAHSFLFLSLYVNTMDEFHYEEVQLSEMMVDGDVLRFPCPCGDLFELSIEDFFSGVDVAQCPTCSLTIKVLFTEREVSELKVFLASPQPIAA